MALSEDQEQARQQLLFSLLIAGERECVLSGPAGSGKTTLMLRIVDDLVAAGVRVSLLAPTGKAALRLSEVVGRRASTIHSALYRTVVEDEEGNLEFSDAERFVDGSSSSVVICDEASMVGARLYGDLFKSLPDSAALLCVGDREQLPPVGDSWGAGFDTPTALLTQIHRQAAGSPIIQLATAIRTGVDWRSVPPDGVAFERRRGTVQQAAAWIALERATGADATLLTYRNRTRQDCNTLARAARGFSSTLEVGDVLVCTRNNYALGIMNGELGIVAEVEPVEGAGGRLCWVRFVGRKRRVVVAPDLLGVSCSNSQFAELEGVCDEADEHGEIDWTRPRMRKLLLRAEYGECLTVHKSQGSQWHTVGVVMDSGFEAADERAPGEFRRLLYTAVTRAAKRLVVWEVG